jgi:uncharacterized protein
MRLSEIRVFPVKGAAAIDVTEWPLDEFGLRHDRRWMVVTDEGSFVTQRDRPRLGGIRQAIEGEFLLLESDGGGSVRVPLNTIGPERPVRIWGDQVMATDAGEDAAAFLSGHLETAAHLVYMPEHTHRQVDRRYAEEGVRVGFADGFPLLLITQESLDELNDRLAEPIGMVRFRPNLVVAGASRPHAEDGWGRIAVGSVECDVVKPCARCVVPTIDPATGVGGREPLRTLATYRTWSRKVYFGQNAIHRAVGTLRVGDPVQVLDEREADPPLL